MCCALTSDLNQFILQVLNQQLLPLFSIAESYFADHLQCKFMLLVIFLFFVTLINIISIVWNMQFSTANLDLFLSVISCSYILLLVLVLKALLVRELY